MNEREQDILYEIRNMYVSGSGIILPRERLGIVVGYMVELEMRISDLTAERDAARKDLAELKARLTKLAEENIRLYNEHESFGSTEDDLIAATWGAAGHELRVALRIESEAPE